MRKILLLIITVFCSIPPSTARDFYGYTNEDPLIIVLDWDFQPFEFINSNGEPAGYNVDVLNMILDNLEIPHHFVMRRWHEATMMFERHEADLIQGLSSAYKVRPYVQPEDSTPHGHTAPQEHQRPEGNGYVGHQTRRLCHATTAGDTQPAL